MEVGTLNKRPNLPKKKQILNFGLVFEPYLGVYLFFLYLTKRQNFRYQDYATEAFRIISVFHQVVFIENEAQ